MVNKLSLKERHISVGGIITAGVLLGTLVAVLNAWDVYGWVTRTAYAQDHEGASMEEQQKLIIKLLETSAREAEIQSKALDMLQAGQDKNQDQWECDETDEELQDLMDKEDGIGLSSKEKRDKKKLDEVWINLNCARFTD
jgi:hypothetical protein